MIKPRHRVRATSWAPPSAAGLARWRRLLEASEALADHWEHSGAGLLRALAAIQRDAYPSRDKESWPILHQWVAGARAFAQAEPMGRAKARAAMADLNAAARAIMGLAPPTAGADFDEDAAYAAGPPGRQRADIWG